MLQFIRPSATPKAPASAQVAGRVVAQARAPDRPQDDRGEAEPQERRAGGADVVEQRDREGRADLQRAGRGEHHPDRERPVAAPRGHGSARFDEGAEVASARLEVRVGAEARRGRREQHDGARARRGRGRGDRLLQPARLGGPVAGDAGGAGSGDEARARSPAGRSRAPRGGRAPRRGPRSPGRGRSRRRSARPAARGTRRRRPARTPAWSRCCRRSTAPRRARPRPPAGAAGPGSRRAPRRGRRRPRRAAAASPARRTRSAGCGRRAAARARRAGRAPRRRTPRPRSRGSRAPAPNADAPGRAASAASPGSAPL